MAALAADFYHLDGPYIESYHAMKAAGYTAIGLKLSDGVYLNWSQFSVPHAARVKMCGLDLIAYHWLQPLQDVSLQIGNFRQQCEALGSMPDILAIDFEWTPSADADLWAKISPDAASDKLIHAFQELRAQLGDRYPDGIKVALYMAPGFWVPFWDALGHDKRVEVIEALNGAPIEVTGTVIDPKRCRLWEARYGVANAPTAPAPFTKVWLWQETEAGAIPGFHGRGDISVFQ